MEKQTYELELSDAFNSQINNGKPMEVGCTTFGTIQILRILRMAERSIITLTVAQPIIFL